MEPAIIVHGGAWAIPDSLAERSRLGVKAAATKGLDVLKEGGSAVDAVEAAVVVLEDDPAFDAGRGSVLNSIGQVEMDSVIMDGSDLKAGAVACVQNIRNPVQLARLIMEKTEHTMVVGEGANLIATEFGIPSVSPDELVTEEARQEFETLMKFKKVVNVSFRPRSSISHDTVGAVAIDRQGNLAFATSTGGITAKRPGRVGDSPLIGSGGYADNDGGGVSTTGHGESITKVCLAHHIMTTLKTGTNAQEAVENSLDYMSSRVGGSGGAIVIDKKGNIGQSFSTERMAWAWARHTELHHGLEHGEDFMETL